MRYYILSGDTLEGSAVFGAAVEYGEEQLCLPALTNVRGKVERLLAAMARGTVTPVSAKDVAEDWLLG